MIDDQSETAVLRQCLLDAERHKLEATLTLAQRDERCMRRAVFLMGLLTALESDWAFGLLTWAEQRSEQFSASKTNKSTN